MVSQHIEDAVTAITVLTQQNPEAGSRILKFSINNELSEEFFDNNLYPNLKKKFENSQEEDCNRLIEAIKTIRKSRDKQEVVDFVTERVRGIIGVDVIRKTFSSMGR